MLSDAQWAVLEPLLESSQPKARLRAGRGLSQVRLALLLDSDGRGVSQSYVSQLEAGKRDTKLSMLIAIAQALEVPFTNVVDHRAAGQA